MPKKAFEAMRNITVLLSGTFAFATGIFSIILLDKGLDLAHLGFFIMVSSASLILFEVPTGAFADAFGRKRAIIIGFLLHILFLGGLILFPYVPVILALAVVGAAGDAMISGSKEAHLVDMISKRKRAEYTQKLLSSGMSWQHLTFFFASIIGGYLATFSIDYPFMIGLAFAFSGLLYSWFGLEEKQKKKSFAKAEKRIYQKMKGALDISLGTYALRTLFILSLLFGLAAFGLFNYWQPVMREMASWDTANMGLFFGLMSIAVIIGSRISDYLKPDWFSIALLYAGLAAFLFLAGWVSVPLAIAALILGWNILFGMSGPVIGTIVNRNTPSKIRATVLSIGSMSVRAGMALFGLLVFFIGADEPRLFWVIGAAFLLLGALVVLVTKKRN